MIKKFDRELYDENNSLGVKAVQAFLESRGNTVHIPDTEQFCSHDFSFTNQKGAEYLAEVERKKVWVKEREWQGWATVDIPYRKSKSKSDYFFMVNNPCNTLILISMNEVKSSPVIEKNTKYTTKEKFYRVPIEKFSIHEVASETDSNK